MLYILLYILIGIVGCIAFIVGAEKRDVTLYELFVTAFLWPLFLAILIIDSAQEIVVFKAKWFKRKR